MCKNIHVCAYLNVALAMPPRLLARVASIRQQQILSITGGEIATQNKDSSILFNMGRNLSAPLKPTNLFLQRRNYFLSQFEVWFQQRGATKCFELAGGRAVVRTVSTVSTRSLGWKAAATWYYMRCLLHLPSVRHPCSWCNPGSRDSGGLEAPYSHTRWRHSQLFSRHASEHVGPGSVGPVLNPYSVHDHSHPPFIIHSSTIHQPFINLFINQSSIAFPKENAHSGVFPEEFSQKST